jgi:dipeptide/tripeptide permease
MNTLIYYSFSLLILSVLVLIIGLIKPKWIFLWMDNPGRMPVMIVAIVLFMIGMVMFGEGNKKLQQEKAQAANPAVEQPAAETPPPPSAPATPAVTP